MFKYYACIKLLFWQLLTPSLKIYILLLCLIRYKSGFHDCDIFSKKTETLIFLSVTMLKLQLICSLFTSIVCGGDFTNTSAEVVTAQRVYWSVQTKFHNNT